MNHTAADHQRAVKMCLLHFQGAVLMPASNADALF